MPETSVLLLARASGRDLLLSASDLIEVLPATSVTPLPGPLPGIAGVILYHGEFLPVLDWVAMPRSGEGMIWATALAVLKRHLVIPLEFLSGALDSDGEGLRVEPPVDDPWAPILACVCGLEGVMLPLLDPDKLIAWLHQLRIRP